MSDDDGDGNYDVSNSMSNEIELSQYLDEVEELDKGVERTDEEEKARKAKGVSNRHDTRGKRLEKSFLDGIAQISKLRFYYQMLIEKKIQNNHVHCFLISRPILYCRNQYRRTKMEENASDCG